LWQLVHRLPLTSGPFHADLDGSTLRAARVEFVAVRELQFILETALR
jgi:hypothetical protein